MEILLSLLSGLLIAVIVQLLLANLGIALGLTVLNWSPATGQEAAEATGRSSSSLGSLPVTHLLGVGVALTLSGVMFVAALLATEFSQIVEPRRGAIFGVILWSAYWLLFAWLSSTTLSAIADSILGTAIAGGRRLVRTLRQALRSPQVDQQDNPEPTWLSDLAAEVAQMTELQQQLPQLLAQQRERLIQEISDRTDLSPQQAEAVVADMQPPSSPSMPVATAPTTSGLLSQLDLPSWQQLLQQALNQVDLSDLDAETLWHRVQTLLPNVAEPDAAEAEHRSAHPLAIVQDAEDYVRHAPSWSFHPALLQDAFFARLYDPDAAHDQIRQQLAQLDQDHYLGWLQGRDDLAADQMTTIADQLSQVQRAVMAKVTPPAAPARSPQDLQEIEHKLTAYCRYTNVDLLTPASLQAKIQTVQAAVGGPALSLEAVNVDRLTEILSRRRGLAADQQQRLTETLQAALGDPEADPEADDRPAKIAQILETTVQSVDWAAVTLEDLKPQLVQQLRSLDLSGELDWQALGSQLQLPPETKTALVNWLQESGQQLSQAPRRWAVRVGQSAQTWTQQLRREMTHYLQFREKSAFQPDQIAADVAHMIKSAIAVLPSPDAWPTVADLQTLVDPTALQETLEHRRDLAAEDIQQLVDWFSSAWQSATQHLEDWSARFWAIAQNRLTHQADNLETVRQTVVNRIADTQQAMQAKATAVKVDIQRQADAARRQVAIAAWWLFLSLLSSGGMAAIAGWLAVKY